MHCGLSADPTFGFVTQLLAANGVTINSFFIPCKQHFDLSRERKREIISGGNCSVKACKRFRTLGRSKYVQNTQANRTDRLLGQCKQVQPCERYQPAQHSCPTSCRPTTVLRLWHDDEKGTAGKTNKRLSTQRQNEVRFVQRYSTTA